MPYFQKLAIQAPDNAKLYKVNIDDVMDLAKDFKIRAVRRILNGFRSDITFNFLILSFIYVSRMAKKQQSLQARVVPLSNLKSVASISVVQVSLTRPGGQRGHVKGVMSVDLTKSRVRPVRSVRSESR